MEQMNRILMMAKNARKMYNRMEKEIRFYDRYPVSRQHVERIGVKVLTDIVKPLDNLLMEESKEKQEAQAFRALSPRKKMSDNEKARRKARREEKKTFHSFTVSYEKAILQYMEDDNFTKLAGHPAVYKYIHSVVYSMLRAQRVRKGIEVSDIANNAYIGIVTDKQLENRWKDYLETGGEVCFFGYFCRYKIMDEVRKIGISDNHCISLQALIEAGKENILPSVMPIESENILNGLTAQEVKAEMKKRLSEREREYLNRYFSGRHIPSYFFAEVKKYSYRNSKTFTVLPSIASSARKVWNKYLGHIFLFNY
jgi:hypothetical protein